MRKLLGSVATALALLGASPALAHPHIFIDAEASITFNDQGEMVAIHNTWTFDEAYSAWSIQGLDTNNDGVVSRAELQPLADDNMDGLAEYEYYTFAGEGKDNLRFVHGSNPTIDYKDGRTTLNFDVALDKPYAIRKSLEIAINDPEYYVAITFKDAGAVKLINAPKQCSFKMEEGHTMPDELADELYAIPPDVTKLPPELEQALRGVQGGILVNCPGGSATGEPGTAETVADASPATALDAVNDLAATSPSSAAATSPSSATGSPPLIGANIIPFGGPPPEPGLNLPRTGFFGWVAQQQKDFYQALTGALGRLRSDWTAFWVLGGLSFLYGIFHAAGPGHGKVVISSYVLANEAQVRRGILLSFLAAMLQSAVAIAFVLIAASVLGMTSLAMSNVANWIGIFSYGLIALLGLWLIVRHLFGLGHHHHHHDAPTLRSVKTAADMQVRARSHMGVPQHALAVGGPSLVSFAKAESVDSFGRMPDDPHYGHSHGHDAGGHDHHDHVHAITPAQLRGGWKEQLGVVLAVGLRPCSGALVILAFALSQGVLLAGMAAVLLMGLGTAITTGTLASLAAGAKGIARRIAGADNPITSALVWWAELIGAVAVLGFGIILVMASFQLGGG